MIRTLALAGVLLASASGVEAGEAAEPPPLTLEAAVAYALEHNPRVAEAAALIREAQGRVRQRRAARLPQAGVNNYVFRQGPVVPSFDGKGNDAVPAWRYNVGIFVSQVLFDWGQRQNAERAAAKEVEAFRHRRGETANDVRLVVGVAFLDVQRADELVRVSQERVTNATEQLRVAKARFETDVAPRFDVIRAEAELADAEQELIESQNDAELARAAFNTALGRDVVTPVRLAASELPEHRTPEFTRLRETALRTRPLIQALAKEIEAGEAAIRSRQAENKPQVTFQATYDRPNPGGFATQTYRYGVGLVMTWPFYDGGFTTGRVREASGTLEATRRRLDLTRQQVDLDLRQAQLDLEEAHRRRVAAAKQLASAREALRVAEVRYRSGVGTTVEVTDAQVALARAGQNVANAQYDYLTALVRLEAATGAPRSAW